MRRPGVSLVDGGGFDFESGTGPRRIEWADILWIGVFKRSNAHGDVTCLWVRASGGGPPVEFQSSDPEWDTLTDAMRRRLRGMKPVVEWAPPVLQPVVEAEMQTVFGRA